MAEYKNLNKELVEQVQLLREELALIRKEHIYLQSKVFEEQQKRVEEKTYFTEQLKALAKSFLTKITEISPDLGDLRSVETNSERESTERRSTNINSYARRKPSSHNFYEYPRSSLSSSSSASSRKSSLTTVSPTRRSSSTHFKETDNINNNSADDDNHDDVEDNQIVEGEIDEATVNKSNGVTDFGLAVLVEGNEDVSSSMSMQTAQSISSESGNEFDESSLVSMEASGAKDESEDEISRMCLTNRMASLDLEAVRSCENNNNNNNSDISKNSHIVNRMQMNFSVNETVCYSPSSRYSTFVGNECPTCSTPKEKPRTSSMSMFKENSDNNGSSFLRPRRKCAPQNLKEPKLSTKLRNNSKPLRK